ncbi:MAG: hypothetical protein J7M17_01320, partial [Anaerolineae bacterium]|nr:hypothetical protein [Anaerolineae bacterium]
LRTDCTDFFIFSREFALFAVDFGLTMRNPKEPFFSTIGHKTLWSLMFSVVKMTESKSGAYIVTVTIFHSFFTIC